MFYDALDIVETKKNNENLHLEVWKDALTNVMPHVEVRSRRVVELLSNSYANPSR